MTEVVGDEYTAVRNKFTAGSLQASSEGEAFQNWLLPGMHIVSAVMLP